MMFHLLKFLLMKSNIFILVLFLLALLLVPFGIDIGSCDIAVIDPVVGGALIGTTANLVGGAVNNIVNRSNMDKQVEVSKHLMDYQWNHFQSPLAQSKSMRQAGLNPAVAFGQGGSGQLSSPSVDMPTAQPSSFSNFGTDMVNSILSLTQAKKAGVESAGQEIENQINRAIMDDRISAAAKANKWTDEQINKVSQEAYNLQGMNTKIQEEINVLRKQGERIDFENKHWLERFNAEMRSYRDKHNIDAQTYSQMVDQAPVILSKLKSEEKLLSLDAEIQGDFKQVTTSLGVVGQVLKVIQLLLRMR